jgi:hypothetical protein
MLRLLALATVVVVLFAANASAADIKVTYLADATSLKKSTPAGTPLTFKLFTDSACATTAVATQVVNVENVTLIEQPKLIRVKGGPKPPVAAEIDFTVTGVTPAPTLYAEVTGTGIVPVGPACQLQTAPTVEAGATAVMKDSLGTVIGALYSPCPDDFDSHGQCVVRSVDGQTVSLVVGTTAVYPTSPVLWYVTPDCTGQPYGSVPSPPLPGSAFVGLSVTAQAAPLFVSPNPLYLPSGQPTTTLLMQSTFYRDPNPADCSQGTFTPPDSCCCGNGNCGGRGTFVPVAQSTLDLAMFVPPFHAEVR